MDQMINQERDKDQMIKTIREDLDQGQGIQDGIHRIAEIAGIGIEDLLDMIKIHIQMINIEKENMIMKVLIENIDSQEDQDIEIEVEIKEELIITITIIILLILQRPLRIEEVEAEIDTRQEIHIINHHHRHLNLIQKQQIMDMVTIQHQGQLVEMKVYHQKEICQVWSLIIGMEAQERE